ncbi:MAG: hypothetical protein AAF449_00320, partial [Myxococcota bacterium]
IAGPHTYYPGCLPGILEEVGLSLARNNAVYLVGGFGGMSRLIYDRIQGKSAMPLTAEWQAEQNPAFLKTDRKKWNEINTLLEALGPEGLAKNNGLGRAENRTLAHTQSVDQIVYLISKGLLTIMSGRRSHRDKEHLNDQ